MQVTATGLHAGLPGAEEIQVEPPLGRKSEGESSVEAEAIRVFPACSRLDYEQAFSLVHENYVSRGYIKPQPSRLWFTYYNFLPRAVTLVGTVDGRVVATVSVFDDSEFLLPMDEIYHAELQTLRSQGRHVAEVGMLADRRHRIGRTLPMLLSLMKLVFDYATSLLQATDACIAVNPRHKEFYRRFLRFDTLGEQKAYPRMEANPAVAHRFRLDALHETLADNPAMLDRFVSEPTSAVVFGGRYHLTAEDVCYFTCQRSDIWRRITNRQRQSLMVVYPRLATMLLLPTE